MALEDYLAGSIAHTVHRGKSLIAKIPRDLPREYGALEQTCRREIERAIETLQSLQDSSIYGRPELQAARLRRFRRVVEDLDDIEGKGIRALARTGDDDFRFNWLVDQVRKEIRFPLPAPVVSTLSTEYFCIEVGLNLLLVPLAEADFFLHLPDLYHELGHLLLETRNDPRIEPFQQSFETGLSGVLDHLGKLEREQGRRWGPDYSVLQHDWEMAWMEGWLRELWCDAFSTFVLGPPYVWSHLHLSAKRDSDPFQVLDVVRSHPPNDARMRLMLACLRELGMTPAAGEIAAIWNRLLEDAQIKPEPEYMRCFPNPLINRLAETAKSGVEGAGCRFATEGPPGPVQGILNEAWRRFWTEPQEYVRWEQDAIRNLYHQTASVPVDRRR